MADHRLEVLEDADAVHRRGAEVIAEAAKADISERGHFALAVSGGRDPWPMFSQLEEFDLDWREVEIFQVDERVAPAGSDQRNLTHLVESLSIGAQGSIRPMPVTDDDLDAAAERYAELLPERLDLVHLGIGPDGHTASLVPGDPVLDVSDRRVAMTAGEYQGHRRMTFTYPELERSGRIFWLVTGEEKCEPLGWLLAGDSEIPAGRVRCEDSLVIADQAACSKG